VSRAKKKSGWVMALRSAARRHASIFFISQIEAPSAPIDNDVATAFHTRYGVLLCEATRHEGAVDGYFSRRISPAERRSAYFTEPVIVREGFVESRSFHNEWIWRKSEWAGLSSEVQGKLRTLQSYGEIARGSDGFRHYKAGDGEGAVAVIVRGATEWCSLLPRVLHAASPMSCPFLRGAFGRYGNRRAVGRGGRGGRRKRGSPRSWFASDRCARDRAPRRDIRPERNGLAALRSRVAHQRRCRRRRRGGRPAEKAATPAITAPQSQRRGFPARSLFPEAASISKTSTPSSP